MNKLSLSLLLAAVSILPAHAAFTQSFFAKSSRLSEGKWVKIGVEKTGVYEISYETLRQMGFSNPEKVGVYGRGGHILSSSFITDYGSASVYDDLGQVKVFHADGKLYFYGLGVDQVSFVNNYDDKVLNGYYKRFSKNIYSNRGYYFLSDSSDVAEMGTSSVSGATTLPAPSTIVSFLSHELDLEHNTTDTGKLFWGEKIGGDAPAKATWEVNIPDAINGSEALMHCEYYLERECPGIFSYGFENGSKIVSNPTVDATSSFYQPMEPTEGRVSVVSGKSKVFASYESSENPSVSNIDFWTITYLSKLPTLHNLEPGAPAQQRFVLSGTSRNSNRRLDFTDGSTFEVFDITRPAEPVRLEKLVSEGKATVKAVPTGTFMEFVVFDTSKPQLQISGYEDAFTEVSHQNLHQYRDEGAEMLIITIPSLRQKSEEIADLHRTHDNINVVVATIEEIYNEFSQGVPDPMAYRLFARMLYGGQHKLRSILFVGPFSSEIRGIEIEKDPFNTIIAYQDNSLSIESGAYHCNDYIGIMKDYTTGNELEKETLDIAIGMLPYRYDFEVDTYIDKIKKHMERTDFAYFINRQINIGGNGDKNAHTSQMVSIGDYVNKYDNKATIHTPIALEAYGYENARLKFMSGLNSGVNCMIYFGHGAENMLTKAPYFFAPGHFNQMHNTYNPLMLFAGCSLSNTDRGRQGLGETIVTHTPNGGLASLIATRDTWSGQNLDLFQYLFLSMYRIGGKNGNSRTESPRLGEIYTQTKNSSSFANELSYHLIGDPELRYHTTTLLAGLSDENIQAVTGEDIDISGFIYDQNGAVNSSFNGEVVLRLMEPLVTQLCPNIVTPEEKSSAKDIYYADTQATMTVASVKDGKFTAKLHVPAYTATFDGAAGRLHFAAYDPDMKVGAGGMQIIYYVKNDKNVSSEESDNIYPSINKIKFDDTDCSLTVDATDNYGLSLASSSLSQAFVLFIDGKEYVDGALTQPILTDENKAYTRHIPINGLSYGQHTARVRVKDVAGNMTEEEIIFLYAPSTPDYELVAAYSADKDMTLFSFAGESPSESVLFITDAHGNEIYSAEVKGAEFSWDHINNAGARVAPGHYKAYIIEKGNSVKKGHSSQVDIPLI